MTHDPLPLALFAFALSVLALVAAVANAGCYDETKPLPPYYPDYPAARLDAGKG